MKIGYASLTYGVKDTSLKTCIAKNATPEKLKQLISLNLEALSHIIDYNRENNIKMFRLSSSLIPFASSPINTLKWWDIFEEQLTEIGKKINEADIRISMHPGQYTVLNSPKDDVVERAIEDLLYHDRLLNALQAGKNCKIILHTGGVYGDKKEAMNRFRDTYARLSESIKARLVIENDDVSYTIADVLTLHKQTGAPVVYDNLHNRILPADPEKSDAYWIHLAGQTWKSEDGIQKIHYSQQDPSRRAGGHSRSINLDEFKAFYDTLPYDLDIMLEVKDKNLSALKVLQLTEPQRGMAGLEKEWARYKYAILEHSPSNYEKIRTLLKDKKSYPVLSFYRLIDEALSEQKTLGHTKNAVDHVWGHFKGRVNEKEKKNFEGYMTRFEEGKLSDTAVKKLLWKFAVDYQEDYLLSSYFFYL